MDQELRRHFERALEDEPVPPPGDLAGAAMAQGTRIRRRRGLLAAAGTAAGVVLILVAVLGLTRPAPQPSAPVAAPATSAPVGDACAMPVNGQAIVASVRLREDVTDAQREAIQSALHVDPVVRVVFFQDPGAAEARFRMLWQDAPGSSPSFQPSPMQGAFLAQLVDPSQYTAFAARFRKLPGVERVVRSLCPQVAPSREHE